VNPGRIMDGAPSWTARELGQTTLFNGKGKVKEIDDLELSLESIWNALHKSGGKHLGNHAQPSSA
jgi:hypothetical protein